MERGQPGLIEVIRAGVLRAIGQKSPIRCLLYTSDAADERSSVDLGGRRIIKKKKKTEQREKEIVLEKHKMAYTAHRLV